MLAAPAVRPRLGRPPKPSPSSSVTSATNDGQNTSDLPKPPTPQADGKSKQASSTGRMSTTKSSTVGTANQNNHETSYPVDRVPASEGVGRSSTQVEPARPVRATRNPNPYYVDAFQLSHRPWSATRTKIEQLNESIYAKSLTKALV